MEFTEYMLWKALALVVLAFIGGFFGWINPHQEEEENDKRLE